MAGIIQRGPHQWRATVQRKGYAPQVKTFETKKDAQAWASVIESEMARGSFIDLLICTEI